MKQRIFLFVTFIILSGISYAQQHPFTQSRDSLYLKGSHYYTRGEKHCTGFLYRRLGQELQVSPNAVVAFKQVRKNYFYALLPVVAGTAVCLTGLFGDFDNQQVNTGLIVGSIPLAGTGIYFLSRAKRSLQESIKIRNEAVLK